MGEVYVRKVGKVYRRLLLMISILFILFSIAILAAGVWFFIERNYMSSLMQSDLFNVASIIIFIVGVLVFVVSFIGCYGAYRGVRKMLLAYFGINLLLVLLTLTAAFVAAAFQGEISGILKSNMEDTLVKRYRNNTHNTTINRVVTEAWDRMQIRLHCCAVDNEGWGLYQNSSWYQYRKHNNYEESQIDLVPESCCRRATYDWYKILNQWQCQKTQGGPPMTPVGSPNNYLNYEGCFEAAKKAMGEAIWFIFGIGLVVTALIIVGMISALCLAIKLKRAAKEKSSPPGGRRPSPRARNYDY